MTLTFDTLHKHLTRTGRLKLLPHLLRELKEKEARDAKRAPKKETAKAHPSLLSGWRSIENGLLIDRTGKRALLEIYKNSI
ncbi:MAG: hypothetical protein WBK28_02400 [Minisyncoccia bacterium]